MVRGFPGQSIFYFFFSHPAVLFLSLFDHMTAIGGLALLKEAGMVFIQLPSFGSRLEDQPSKLPRHL